MSEELLIEFANWVFIVAYGWFFAGAVLAILYHVSLYTFDGEFRLGSERALDLAVSILRGLAYFIAWPLIFIFDTSAARRIWLYLRYLNPRIRATDPSIAEALKERDYRIWSRSAFLDKTDLEDRRARELETHEQHQRRLFTLKEDSPLLDRYWLLTGIGTHYMAVEELVRLYPDYHLPEEIEDGVRRELWIRYRRNCAGCHEQLRGSKASIPGVVYLRVLEAEGRRAIIEGWAIEGSYELQFEPCGRCGIEPEPVQGDLAACGRTRDVIRRAKLGKVLHSDLP